MEEEENEQVQGSIPPPPPPPPVEAEQTSGSVPPPPPPPSTGGASTNFPEDSSEQSEGSSATTSQELSQPQETGGETPIEPTPIVEPDQPFTPFVTQYAKTVNQQANKVKDIRDELKNLSATMIRTDIPREERVKAAEKRDQLKLELDQFVTSQLNLADKELESLKEPLKQSDIALSNMKAQLIESGFFTEGEDGITQSTTQLPAIEQKITQSVEERVQQEEDRLAKLWDEQYKPQIDKLQSDPNATQEQIDAVVNEYNQQITQSNQNVTQYRNELIGAAESNIDQQSAQVLKLLNDYNLAVNERNKELDAYNKNVSLYAGKESALKAMDGTFGGYVQNMVTGQYGDYLSGLSEVMGKYMIQPITEAMGAPKVSAEGVREAAGMIGESFKQAAGDEETTPEYVERLSEEDFVLRSTVGGLASVPLMLTPFQTGIFFSAYKNAGDEVEGKNLSDTEKELYKVFSGGFEMALERLGMAKVLSKNPVLKRAVLGRVMPKMTKNTTAKQLESLIMSEVKSLPKSASANMIRGVGGEGVTGAAQEAASIGLREIFNTYKAEEVFETKSIPEYVEDIAMAGAEEAVGSILLTGTINAANGFANSKGGVDVTESDLEAAQMLASNPEESLKVLSQYLKGKPQSYVDGVIRNATELAQTLQKLPPDLKTNKEAVALVKEKASLEEENKTLDSAFQEGNKERIQQIDERLKKLKDDVRKETPQTEEGGVRDREQEQATTQEAQDSEVGQGEQQAQTRGEEELTPDVRERTETDEGLPSTPPQEKILEDINKGNVVTFTYQKGEDIPPPLRSRVSSVNQDTGERRVTLSKSEADFLLQQQTQEQDAIQERQAEEVDVREQAVPSEEMVGEVREEKTPSETTQEEIEVTEETPSEEAKQRAEKFGFAAPVQARRAAVKHLGKPKDVKVEDLTDEELREASQRSVSSPVAVGNKVDVVVEEYNDRGKKVDNSYTAEVVSVNEDGTYNLKRGNTTFKNVAPKEIKKTPRKPRTTPLDDIKQGFIEYTEAMKEKSREKLDKAVSKVKDRLDKQVQKAKDLRERKKLIKDFANSLIDDLRKQGVKYIPTSKVKTILNQVDAAKTEESTRKAADKLIKTFKDIAVNDEEAKQKAQQKKDVKQAKKNAKMGKFGDLESAYAIVNLKEVPEFLEKEYYKVMSNLGQRGAFEIDTDAVNDLYEKLSKQPELTQEQSEVSPKEKPDVTENVAAVEAATEDLTEESISSLPTDYKSLLRQFKKVPPEFLSRYGRPFLKNLEAAILNASNGVMSGNAVSSVVRDYEASLDAKDVVDSNILEKTAEEAKKAFKGISRIFTKDYYKNRKSKSVSDLFKDLTDKYAAYFDDVLGSFKGTPIYEAFNNVSSAKSAAESATDKVKAEFAKKLKSAIRSRIPVLKRAAQVSAEPFFRLSAKAQLYLQQKQFEDNPNSKGVQSIDDIIQNIKDNPVEFQSATGLSPQDIEIILDEYERGTVDGKLSADKMWSSMNSQEKALINYMRDVLDNDTGKKSRYINIAWRNNPLPQFKSYFPRSGTSEVDSDFDFFESLVVGKLGRQSFKTQSSNERAATIQFISFSPFNDFMAHVSSVNYDYHLTPQVARFNSMAGQISDIAKNEETKKVGESLRKIMKATLNTSFNERNNALNSGFSDSLGRSVIGAITRNLLIKPTRLVSEFVFNYLPVVTLKSRTLLRSLPQRKAFNKTNALEKIQQQYGSVQLNRVGSYKLDMTDLVQGIDKRFRTVSDGAKNAAEKLIKNNYLSDFSKAASSVFYKITDSAAKPLWEATFLEEFKSITGKEFNAQEFTKDDNVYSDQYKRAIEKAKARADKKVSSIFNTAERMEAKLKQQQRTGVKSLLYDFMQSFSYNEQPAIREAIHSMWGHGTYGRLDGLTTFLALSTRAIGYQVLNAYLFDLTSNLVTNLIAEGKFSFEGDDEEDLELDDELNRGIASYAMLMAMGNKPAFAKALVSFGINLAYRFGYYPYYTEKGKEGKEFDIYRDSPLFSPDFSKQGLTGLAGGLGILSNESEKLAKSSERFIEKVAPKIHEGDLTLQEAIDAMNESKMNYYMWKNFNKVLGVPMGGLEYPIVKGLENRGEEEDSRFKRAKI